MNIIDWPTLLRNERLPAAIVDLDAFDRNLQRLKKIFHENDPTGKKTLRLATKSIRVPKLIERALNAGAPISGLMCYSAEEIEFLAGHGFDDFMLAYPTVQASDLLALRKVFDQGKKLSVVVDCVEHLRALSEAFQGGSNPLPVLIDLDLSLRFLGGRVHLGVRRSPLRSVQDVFRIFNELRKFPQLRFQGIMAYEAQVAGLGDRNPFSRLFNPIKHWIRKLSVKRIAKLRGELMQAFRNQAITVEVFNGGGTGSLNFSLEEEALTEVAAGSALFAPHLFDYYSNIEFEPACFFALQAVRAPDPGYLTCQGGGYVASGEPGWDKMPVPFYPERSTLVSAEACGEVQTPVRVRTRARMDVGSPIIFRHSKAGELAERFNEVVLVCGGMIVSREKTYRGHGQSFF